MLTILRLNWRMYMKSAILTTFSLFAAAHLNNPWRLALSSAAGMALLWTATSLAASWWIYDHSGIYQLHWLDGLLKRAPGRWLNLHNGLDELTTMLRDRYPETGGQTLDIFDPREMTEPSILEARRQLHQSMQPNVDWRCLPAENQSFDTVLVAFTAHEFRRAVSRERLFIELQRVLRDSGRLILVEHLRDTANFAAFGPGAMHFHSRRAWLDSTAPAGLALLEDRPLTPFVHAFVFGKKCAP